MFSFKDMTCKVKKALFALFAGSTVLGQAKYIYSLTSVPASQNAPPPPENLEIIVPTARRRKTFLQNLQQLALPARPFQEWPRGISGRVGADGAHKGRRIIPAGSLRRSEPPEIPIIPRRRNAARRTAAIPASPSKSGIQAGPWCILIRHAPRHAPRPAPAPPCTDAGPLPAPPATPNS